MDSTPHLAWKQKLHCPVHYFIRSHLIPLDTLIPYCYKIHFNIIIPEVACWFFHFGIFLAFRTEPTLEGQVLVLLPAYLEAVSSVGHQRTRSAVVIRAMTLVCVVGIQLCERALGAESCFMLVADLPSHSGWLCQLSGNVNLDLENAPYGQPYVLKVRVLIRVGIMGTLMLVFPFGHFSLFANTPILQ